MRRKLLVLAFAMAFWPLISEAVTRDNFLLRNTQDLIELCSVRDNDPMHSAAISFCHGYGLGAFHYYQAIHSSPQGKPFVCLPDPIPSRTEGVKMFIAWAKENPQYMNEPAVESLFRFLAAKWPCKN